MALITHMERRMGLAEYRVVIEQFCDAADIDNVGDLLHRGAVLIGQNAVLLEYAEEVDQCRITLDLGEPQGEDLGSLYRLLLESNFDLAPDLQPVHALHPESGHAILILHISLCRLQTDVNLFELMTQDLDVVIETWSDIFRGAQTSADAHVDSVAARNLA
jgi:hypothetical protein